MKQQHVKRLVRKAKILWNCGEPRLDRHNRRAWVRSVLALGDKWLLAQPMQRQQ